MKKSLIFITLCFIFTCNIYSKVIINEICASNGSVNYDPDFFNFENWAEFYNTGNEDIDISGWYLTDNHSVIKKWTFPVNTIIPAKKFLLVWFDNMNTKLHTSFKLSSFGESLYIYDKNLNLVDMVIFPPQFPNISYGRKSDAVAEWSYFGTPTPNESNNTQKTAYQLAPSPEFDKNSGFYPSPITVKLVSTLPLANIYYTLDGSEPTINSSQYILPIAVSKTTVIRSKVFASDYLPSNTITKTYLINETIKLPVVSVSCNPDYLFDNKIGIYVVGTNGVQSPCGTSVNNFNRDWERQANIEYFDINGNPGFNSPAGISISGNCTRTFPQKSLDVEFRGKYGNNEINYPLFKSKPQITTFKSFKIRNSGNDWNGTSPFIGTMMCDGMLQTLIEGQMNIDYQAYQPSVIFINGEYYGIQNIREKMDADYIANNHPEVNSDSLDIISFWKTIDLSSGDSVEWHILADFLRTKDLSIPANYDYVKSKIEIADIINYYIVETYVCNIDWPKNNMKMWRERSSTGKWRWMIYDLDFGFGGQKWVFPSTNMMNNASKVNADAEWATLAFNALIKNENFKKEFAQRYINHVNTTFDPTRVKFIIDSLKNTISPEISRHAAKWAALGGVVNFTTWSKNVDKFKSFAEQRPAYAISQMKSFLGFSTTMNITVENKTPDLGDVYIFDRKIPTNPYTTEFFKDFSLEINTKPRGGYTFDRWEKANNNPITTTPYNTIVDENLNIKAYFKPVTAINGLYINEMLTKNISTISDEGKDFDDWIELYNSNDSAIDVGGLYLTDSASEKLKWQIPVDAKTVTLMPAKSHLLIWCDDELFEGKLHTNFKLSSTSGVVFLSQELPSKTTVVDSLKYSFQIPDKSIGRTTDGANSWSFFRKPTPSDINLLPNTAPFFTNVRDTVILDNINFSLTCLTKDNEDDLISAFVKERPSWLSYSINSNGNIVLTGKPTFANIGQHLITLSLNDGLFYEDVLKSFTIKVVKSNTVIDEIHNSPFKIYPNPAKTSITFDLKSQTDLVQIIDMCGQLVFQNSTVNNRIDISALKTGIYILQLKDVDNVFYNQRFVKL